MACILSSFPRIYDLYRRARKIHDITGHDGEIVMERRCRQQTIDRREYLPHLFSRTTTQIRSQSSAPFRILLKTNRRAPLVHDAR